MQLQGRSKETSGRSFSVIRLPRHQRTRSQPHRHHHVHQKHMPLMRQPISTGPAQRQSSNLLWSPQVSDQGSQRAPRYHTRGPNHRLNQLHSELSARCKALRTVANFPGQLPPAPPSVDRSLSGAPSARIKELMALAHSRAGIDPWQVAELAKCGAYPVGTFEDDYREGTTMRVDTRPRRQPTRHLSPNRASAQDNRGGLVTTGKPIPSLATRDEYPPAWSGRGSLRLEAYHSLIAKRSLNQPPSTPLPAKALTKGHLESRMVRA